jgi:hypothetical protein
MRIQSVAFLVLISILFLCGCYESEVPLSKNPSSKVDPRLIGSWIRIPKNDNEKGISLLLINFNDNEYLIAWKEDGDNETVIARGFNTKIYNTNIINLQNIVPIDKNDRTYVFSKYEFNAKGNLVVNIISDDFADLKGKKFMSSKEFNDFIKQNIYKDGLFGDSIEFQPTKEINFGINLKSSTGDNQCRAY